jgi:hypothetical protein
MSRPKDFESETRILNFITDHPNCMQHEISKELNIQYSKVGYILKQNSIKLRVRKHEIDEKYFDTLSVNHKLYFLGYMFADGYVNSKGTVQLQLHIKDIEILTKFNTLISKGTNLVKILKNNMVRFEVSSKYMVSTLAGHGCTQGKTFTLKFPHVENGNLVSHFLRGYFDGDGCVTFNKNCAEFNILGTENFCTSYKELLLSKVDDSIKISISLHGKNKSIYRLRILSTKHIIKVLEYLYKDCDEFFLKRKYEKYIQLIEHNNRIRKVNQYS